MTYYILLYIYIYNIMRRGYKRRTMNGKREPGTGRTMYTIGAASNRSNKTMCDLTTTIENIKRVQDYFVTPFSDQKYHLIKNPFIEIGVLENNRKNDCTNGLLTDFMQKVVTAANLASSLNMFYKSSKIEIQEQESIIANLSKRIRELENMLPNKSGNSGLGVEINASICAPGIPILSFIANINLTMALYHLHFFKGWKAGIVKYEPDNVLYINAMINSMGAKNAIQYITDEEKCLIDKRHKRELLKLKMT